MAFAALTARRVTPAALARELGVSRQAINDLQRREILPRSDDGLIDIDYAKTELSKRLTRPDAKTTINVSPIQSPQPAITQPQPENADVAVTSYHVARTLREAAEARMAQLKLHTMQGDLCDAKLVDRTAAKLGRMLRDSLLGLPPKIAPTIATMTDPLAIQNHLNDALRHLLDDIVAMVARDIADDDRR